jgi:hypothetical protein
MARSKPATVSEYLKTLTPEQRKVIGAVRKVVKDNLPDGYREASGWGGITYEVPLDVLADTYNKQPLCYAALGAHKSYYTLYLMAPYGSAAGRKDLAEGFRKAGKKLDMGKSCVHFKKLDDLPLDVIAKSIASTPMEKYVQRYKGTRGR